MVKHGFCWPCKTQWVSGNLILESWSWLAAGGHLLAAVSSTFMIWIGWAQMPGVHVSVALGNSTCSGQVQYSWYILWVPLGSHGTHRCQSSWPTWGISETPVHSRQFPLKIYSSSSAERQSTRSGTCWQHDYVQRCARDRGAEYGIWGRQAVLYHLVLSQCAWGLWVHFLLSLPPTKGSVSCIIINVWYLFLSCWLQVPFLLWLPQCYQATIL